MPADQATPPPLGSVPNRRPDRLAPFRFSMRTLLSVMTALALICGLAAALPTAVSQIAIGIIWIVASGWLITGMVFAGGDARAFCIGAAVVATSMWTGIGGGIAGGIRSLLKSILYYHTGFGPVSNVETWLVHMVLAAAAIGNGYLCIRARRYFEPESS